MRELREPPSSDFLLRVMTEADLSTVMEIERHAFKNPWSADLLKRELEHEWSTIYLAEEPHPQLPGMRVLGLIIFWVVHDELHILNVATAAEQRRRGVGRYLLDAALDHGRRKGCTLTTLEVRRSNVPAIGLYRAFAFRPVGVRPNYYVDEGEDALVMVRDL